MHLICRHLIACIAIYGAQAVLRLSLAVSVAGGASLVFAQAPTPAASGSSVLANGPSNATIVRLPTPAFSADGQLTVQPNVGNGLQPPGGPPLEMLPEPVQPGGNMPSFAVPLFEEMGTGDAYAEESWPIFYRWMERWRAQRERNKEPGIGRERLIYAPTEIDIAQPQDNFRMRMNAAYGWEQPDRAELLWSKAPRGPAPPETAVNYQDFLFYLEQGGPKFSLATEIPIRLLNPEINDNTAGMGDMTVTQKLVMIEGSEWQMTQLFRTYMATGSSIKGLGAGHFSLEPGWLMRYRWCETLAFHGEVKYQFPLGGDPNHSGQVLRYGLGWSHVLREGDTFAILDTCELINVDILDGRTTLPIGIVEEIGGVHIVNVAVGLRCVVDTGGDMGVMEYGLAAIHHVTTDGLYDSLLRFDVRWIW